MLNHLLAFTLILGATSTKTDRKALYEYIVETTMAREAFSPIKNQRLQLDVYSEMEKFREEFLEADTDKKLFHALTKISNARKDSHLSVEVVSGGLSIDTTVTKAAIQLRPDFSSPDNIFLFVSDTGKNNKSYLGCRVLAVNDRTDFAEYLEPFVRYSTTNKFWWELANMISKRDHLLPSEFYRKTLDLTLECHKGTQLNVSLNYHPSCTVDLLGQDEPSYPGFGLIYKTSTYSLYQHLKGEKVLLIAWYGFREHLVQDIDKLMNYAVQNSLLNHSIIFDATRSRGGSKGAYAIQRLSPHSFKTTFGNLRISDVTKLFVENKKIQFLNDKVFDGTESETVDGGSWLIDWLSDDVLRALADDQSYTNNVPFKLAHLPKYSDGIIRPSEIHFHGQLVVLLGPHGGSHLDQFAAIVADNNLGHIIGMPAGGYSNTWEWEEELLFPNTSKPVVKYMWSIGHTIRPNGQLLEGNPAEVHDYIPLSSENFRQYYEILLKAAFQHLKLK